jgi:hypothetical protein
MWIFVQDYRKAAPHTQRESAELVEYSGTLRKALSLIDN